MFAAGDPNLIIGGLAVGGLALYALWGLIAWVRRHQSGPIRGMQKLRNNCRGRTRSKCVRTA